MLFNGEKVFFKLKRFHTGKIIVDFALVYQKLFLLQKKSGMQMARIVIQMKVVSKIIC
jgi:hypothetical protein